MLFRTAFLSKQRKMEYFMRRWNFCFSFLLLIVIVSVVVVSIDVYRSMNNINTTTTYKLWYRNSDYAKVHPGMTENQVLHLLGNPRRRFPNPTYEYWTYSIHTPVKSHKITWLNVYLDPNGKVTNVVIDVALLDMLQSPGIPKVGMKRQQVLQLLGKPKGIRRNKCVIFWSYNLWNNGKFQVLFDNKGRVWRAVAVAHQFNMRW